MIKKYCNVCLQDASSDLGAILIDFKQIKKVIDIPEELEIVFSVDIQGHYNTQKVHLCPLHSSLLTEQFLLDVLENIKKKREGVNENV